MQHAMEPLAVGNVPIPETYQDSRESSASNWDLSSLCDSCCLNTGHHRMGAGTYANAASPGPGLLRRRYSVPEIIMRKHTLAQQKTDDEPLWLHHDSNHNVIEVVVNKQAAPSSARGLLLNGRLSGPRTPPHRKSFGLRHHREHQHGSLTGRSSSVESGGGGGGLGTHDWLAAAGTTGTLTATGSDPNLASLKHRNLGGRCSSPLCNGGVGLGRAMANGTGGSLRSIHNNSLSCSSSSSVNGVPLANGGVVVGGGVGVGGCGLQQQQQQQQQHYPVVPSYRDGDYSMRKTTLLRRMWSRELRRYERSGSWSPPLRRAPRRIYSVESIVASVEGRASRADDAESVASRRPGSSSDGSGRCATTATTMTAGTTDTTTTTTGTTSCRECAKLEAQYSGDFGTGRKLLSRARSRDIECCSSGDVSDGGPECPVPVSNAAPTEPVDDRRQQPRRRRRMCSSQTADLGESEPIILAAGGGAVSATTTVHNGPHGDQQQHGAAGEEEEDEDEYASHSSSVSSIASQSYRVPSASRRPDHELSEFLQQERLAAADGDGADRAAGREVAAVRAGSAGAGDHPRERAPAADGTAGTATAAAAAASNATEPAERGVSEQQDNALSAATLSEDSSESSDEEGDGSDTGGAGDNRTPHAGGSGVDEAEQTRLDEYISGLLLDNLNNIADAKELVLATDARDGETILGVYSERRAQLAEHGKPTEADRQNNNNQTVANGGVPEHAGGGTMKQKLTEKYIGDGGGVVCNSPPQPDKRKPSPKPGDEDGAECDKENEEDVANNNGNGKANSNNNATGEQRNHRRQKQRSKGGFFLRSGSRSPRPAAEPALGGGAAEIDLNGKYYFPAYGLETDPSDNTDIASEPEGLVLGKIGTGSTYDRGSAVVPRFSAMPRTESMEVQPSSTNSAEDDVDGAVRGGRRKVRAVDDEDDDEDDDVDDSDASSLVDSLDGFGPPQMVEMVPPRSRKPRPPVKAVGGGEVGESTTSSTDRSPRHEKGEAFFVPIHAERAAAFKLDERVVVADTMPLRIKERLNNRRRLMKWKQEQENLKKQRKMMRLIEQKRFYGEPAIQVISTIDKAISRKEFIPPGARKSVFGGAGVTTPIVRDTSTPSGPTPFRAMKPKKRAGGPAATGSTGSALRSELGMLESYKIDGKGNMQIQTAAATASSAGGRKGAVAPAAAAKGAWGMGTERRQASKTPHAPTTATTMTATASTTVGGGGSSARTSTGVRTGGSTGKASGGRRRQQVLKDVQQMTLYPQADLTPDIEGGPRRVYQKTEIQEGDKHIEILEIVECADSAPRNRHGGGGSRPARVHSAGRRGRGDSGNRNRSRIPVPIYRFGQYRRSTQSRDGSPLSTGSNPKVDRMIADLLLEALTNPEEVGVKLVRTPDALRDASRASSKARPSGASASKKTSSSSATTGHGGGGANGSNNNLLTPRRTASGRYTQKFEVIPEERSSVSIESSTEELSTGGSNRKKGPHPSPRRVSFDENHQILNRDELEGPTLVVPPVPSPKRSKSPAKSPTRRQQPTAAAPAASPAKKQGTATVLTNTTTNTTATATTTTTSRGKAAIQSDVIEEKGWIGFSTQHEDMATPIHNGPDDEGGANGSNNNLLTPRRTASGRYTQKFEVIPEERSSVSIESSTEELSTGGSNRKKGPHPSPRRVSFDENHQILNRDELEGPTLVVPPVPSPKRSKSPAKSPTRRQQPTTAAAAASPAKKQGTATVLTNTTTNTTATATTTTTSRGKAAIQSDVIEEKGWIGFSTQHEDMATPIHNGPDDEGLTRYLARIAQYAGMLLFRFCYIVNELLIV
ncbi:AGAP013458-PC [Anopheles gambiae str. PEST]|uniref:AGAP013458-PC n=1 Tax=Anopheles gambiae TaxID=7165 RepID=F5HMF9_ANOGA|nr:AGAP013458-PC [Anopheles gambiae str. PEST]